MDKLLKQLEELKKRAAAELAKIKDDTAPEAARAIEADHGKILQEIRDLEAKIAAKRQAGGEEGNDDPAATATAASRAADIVGIAALARTQGVEISTEDEQSAIRSGTTPEQFRAQMFERLAARSRQTQTSSVHVTQDETETQRAAMVEALSYSFGAPIPAAGPSAAARNLMGQRAGDNASIIELAAQRTGWKGGYIRNARQIDEIYTRAFAPHTTSDFPAIFEASINRTLEGRYALAQPTYRRIARKRNFRDFRPHTTVKAGDFPMLLKVLESGEIKYGTFSEGKEVVQAFSYARALSISRQMLINDDLGAISDVLADYGPTVALFEELTFYSSALNGVLSDTKTVFHTDHGNLAGTPSVIDVANVAKGRAALSKQKSIDGNPLLQNAARLILTGPDKITEAEMLVATITPATVATVNIFSGKLDTQETSQIVGNAWYLFADPSVGSNYRWGYLEGFEGPRARYDQPFGVQGISMSVELDFGCGATDYRYGYKNAGA